MKHMIDPDTALKLVVEAAQTLAAKAVDVSQATGLALAQEVRSDRAYPPFSRAMMDGFAVRMADVGKTVPIIAEVAAGQDTDLRLTDGNAVSIMTGAPCPDGTEAVVPIESTEVAGNRVTLPENFIAGKHFATSGSECPENHLIAGEGEAITPILVANLATFGYTKVSVVPRPSIAIITTGSEIVAQDQQPGKAQIRSSNGPMLAACCQNIGLSEIQCRHALDTPDALRNALEQSGHADVVVLSGGVSAGKYDIVPATLAGHGVETIFHKVTQKPGKPLLFGQLGGRLFFGLPGNPLSSHFCFHRYVAPACRIMMGKPREPQSGIGILTQPLRPRGARTLFKLCRTVYKNGTWEITPIKGKGSADIFSACSGNSFIRMEPDSPSFEQGQKMEFTWIEGQR